MIVDLEKTGHNYKLYNHRHTAAAHGAKALAAVQVLCFLLNFLLIALVFFLNTSELRLKPCLLSLSLLLLYGRGKKAQLYYDHKANYREKIVVRHGIEQGNHKAERNSENFIYFTCVH